MHYGSNLRWSLLIHYRGLSAELIDYGLMEDAVIIVQVGLGER